MVAWNGEGGEGSRSKRQETQPSVPKAETILVTMKPCWPGGSALTSGSSLGIPGQAEAPDWGSRGAHPSPKERAPLSRAGGVGLSGFLGAPLVLDCGDLEASRGSTLPHTPPSPRAPSPSLRGSAQSQESTPSFLAWGWGGPFFPGEMGPRGNQTPKLPVTAPCWTDLARCGLSQLSGFSQASPTCPLHLSSYSIRQGPQDWALWTP